VHGGHPGPKPVTGPMPEPRWTSLENMTDDELNYALHSAKAAFTRNGWVTAEEWNELEAGESRTVPAPGS
jgi:hypothetical protein